MPRMEPSPGGKVVRDLIRKFPDAPAMTLAKRAYREHPELFNSLEHCRTLIRHALGLSGKANRSHKNQDQSLHRKPRPAGWTGVIPEAIHELPGWGPLEITSSERALILSDVHIPFFDSEALESALDYGEKRKPTLVILNGDISDHFSISRWLNNPKLRDFPAEVKAARFFLSGLRKRFASARIIYKKGNHEERFDAYMRMKCPEFLGVENFDWAEVFDLDDNRIELVEQKRPIRLGKLNIIHGHEYSFPISSPVNPARGFYLRAKTHVIGGHLHQTSQHSEKNLENKVVSAWSTGCLCNLHPEYRPLNQWNHGFAFVESDGHDFRVDNLRIVDGKVY